MQALTLTPGMKDSLQLREIPDPPPGEGPVLVEAVALSSSPAVRRPLGEFAAWVWMSVSWLGPAGQLSQQRPDRFGHVGFLPVMANSAVTVMNVDLVAELVCSVRSVHKGALESRRQESPDNLLLVHGKVCHVERGDHVQTREATTADRLQVHQTTGDVNQRRCRSARHTDGQRQRTRTLAASQPARTACASAIVEPYHEQA
ncbi:MAG: hypothetical protein ACYDC9_14200 [Dermatophilaceae bacterium]